MKNIQHYVWLSLTIAMLASCKSHTATNQQQSANPGVPVLQAKNFADTINGKTTSLYLLKNKNGMQVAITNYGARLVSIVVPDKNNVPTDVIIGFTNVKEYVTSPDRFYGAIIGRVANRIAKGMFTLGGKTYHLAINNPPNSLHGGEPGYQDVVWDATQPNDSTVELSYLSKDGQANYPGNLQIHVTYTLGSDNALKISYEAQTDKTTLVSLTNHSYFNLNGEGSGTIDNQELQLNADQVTPVDSTQIPTGKFDSVAGTPFDFRTLTAIGKRIGEKNTQLAYGKGYDVNYVLNNPKAGSLFHAATVIGDKSGIQMDVYTVEPGLQFYSGNFMAGNNILQNKNIKDGYRTAFCLETQHYPDAPNHKNFPSIVLKPGKKYATYSIYKFSVEK
ncbi:aldose epimerase family protein [Microbacter margulisiae]|uniref:Aldose 1-epimerase n=1 Tax=Microbacter margulisiae TaxID=1350067 RepID=A0A7W5DTY3_9PORP|nr:aldose epimerase family protein [Microbacter margulisiae]MBB3188648.1 aldose 1-epimerase [Microbacter margulisiae]